MMIKEFREFILRGNVIDLAVGVVIGAAFGALVASFVDDILMPPIGMLTGGVNFSELYIALDGIEYESLTVAQEAGAPTLNYGIFIMAVIDFLIIAVAIFLVIKAVNRLRREEEKAPAEPVVHDCPYCSLEIPIKASRCPHCTSQLEVAT
jgi:large conductance mechanosensitive channel